MTIKQLVETCENCKEFKSVMVYRNAEAFDCDLCDWWYLSMEQARACEGAIAKFRVYRNFIAVALA